MRLDLAVFDGDTLLARTSVMLGETRKTEVVVAGRYEFESHHAYQEPSSPVDITCRANGRHLYRAALQVGVHNSDDWESIELGTIHTLGFRCSGVSVG